jgi:phage-related minor tail protein
MRHSRLAIILLAALLLLAGCGATSISTAGVTDKICQGLAAVEQPLNQLANVGDQTTVGEVKALQQKVTNALGVLTKIPGLSDSSALSQLQQANDELTAAIQGQPDDATMGQVGPKFQDFKSKVAQAQSKLNSMKSTFKC